MHLFIQLAHVSMPTPDCRFLVVGGKRDRENAELLRPVLGSRLINLAGQRRCACPRRLLANARCMSETTAARSTWRPPWASRLSRSPATRNGDPCPFPGARTIRLDGRSDAALSAHGTGPVQRNLPSPASHIASGKSPEEVLEACVR